MPRRVLLGQARDIVAWCRENDKSVPTLLDLGLARREVRKIMAKNKAREKRK